jgi:hypothetical protein
MELTLDLKLSGGGSEVISDRDLYQKWATDLILAVLVDGSFLASGSKAPSLTNDSLGRLAAGRLSEGLILRIIEVYRGDYQTSCTDLAALRRCGLGDKVVEAVVWKALEARCSSRK